MVNAISDLGTEGFEGGNPQSVQTVRWGQSQQNHLQKPEENRSGSGREDPRRVAEGNAGGGWPGWRRHAQLRIVLQNHEEEGRSPRRLWFWWWLIISIQFFLINYNIENVEPKRFEQNNWHSYESIPSFNKGLIIQESFE